MSDSQNSGEVAGASGFAEDLVRVAELEIRWRGGDSARVRECIDIGLEIAIQLMGGMDEHGLGPEIPEDASLLPVECASYQRYMMEDPGQ